MRITTGGTQKETQIVELAPQKVTTLHYDLDYDFTKPEETLRDFVSNMKAMVTRFEYNKARIIEIEAELVDLYHYIEISPFKNIAEGYRLYRKHAELRRERRACKNENDLLWPIYEHFHATEVLNKLTTVQGEVAKCKAAIDARTYMVRTDILDEYLDPPVKVSVVTEEEPVDIEALPVLQDQEELNETFEPKPIMHRNTKDKPMSAFKLAYRAAN